MFAASTLVRVLSVIDPCCLRCLRSIACPADPPPSARTCGNVTCWTHTHTVHSTSRWRADAAIDGPADVRVPCCRAPLLQTGGRTRFVSGVVDTGSQETIVSHNELHEWENEQHVQGFPVALPFPMAVDFVSSSLRSARRLCCCSRSFIVRASPLRLWWPLVTRWFARLLVSVLSYVVFDSGGRACLAFVCADAQGFVMGTPYNSSLLGRPFALYAHDGPSVLGATFIDLFVLDGSFGGQWCLRAP